MHRFLIVIAVLELAACGVSLPDRTYVPNVADRALFDELDVRWREAGLGDPKAERCEELRPYLRVVLADDQQFPAMCTGYCNPGHCPGYRSSEGCAHGCAGECVITPCAGSWPHCWGTGSEFLGGHEHALIVLHESHIEHDGSPSIALTRHGYLHFLTSCTGLIRGSTDPGHADARVWALDR